jgi:hypothetical protein
MINFLKRYQSYILITAAVLAFGFWMYTSIQNANERKPVIQAEILREQIIASISNPFPKGDTLILETRRMLCGNTTPGQIPETFETYLDSSYYKKKLQDKLQMIVFIYNDYFQMLDSICKIKYKGDLPQDFWDSFNRGKVSATIGTEKISSTKVNLNEYYEFNGISKSIHKEFIFQNNTWIYRVTN